VHHNMFEEETDGALPSGRSGDTLFTGLIYLRRLWSAAVPCGIGIARIRPKARATSKSRSESTASRRLSFRLSRMEKPTEVAHTQASRRASAARARRTDFRTSLDTPKVVRESEHANLGTGPTKKER